MPAPSRVFGQACPRIRSEPMDRRDFLFTLGAIVPTLVTTGIALVVPPPLNATIAALIVLPYLAFFISTLHIADYVSYRDVFHAGETLAPIARTDSGAAG